jgi:hypothetical protein
MEEAPVRARPDLIDHIGLQIDVERPRNVLARGGLREESAEAIIVSRRRSFDQTTVRLR